MSDYDIPYYLDYLSPDLLQAAWQNASPSPAHPDLRVAPKIQSAFAHLETPDVLQLICQVYDAVQGELAQVLAKRGVDRQFIDGAVRDLGPKNEGVDYLSPDYQTVIGQKDGAGRVVVGPLETKIQPKKVEIPPFLKGAQVTLFGPPDTKKMSINAMNAFHRRLPNENPLITELVENSSEVARWGADNEDSKTPIMANFLHACENLLGCFDRSLSFDDKARGKAYRLADDRLSHPIKRIPGLALPDGNHLYRGNPLPLHLVDFVMHMAHNWAKKEALIFYVPKLENEEEAHYLKNLIAVTEAAIHRKHPSYELGSVKLFIVFESPRSIFRITEIADTLHPHFVGGSLGWHDFLASTARLFRKDPNYRIPVKADPNIVINHIKESHLILGKCLGPMGAIKIGGMYGILYEEGNAKSFEVTMVGYIKDVITQLKRDLDGFWVAHPNFVRLGIALVEAWKAEKSGARPGILDATIKALVPNGAEQEKLLEFVKGEDVPGLDENHPLYHRGVLAADLKTSSVIRNDDPDEIRYNIFQALQYLADWLCGNGCVALPAQLKTAEGKPVFVRIMDDLATTERSRWELWAEINHGRVSQADFDRYFEEEYAFIVNGQDTETKRVQVKYQGEAAKWYPTAKKLLKTLVEAPNPPEFVTELLMPFTLDIVRDAENPWAKAQALCPGKYRD